MKEDETVTIKLDELVGLFERIDQLESDVAELKAKVESPVVVSVRDVAAAYDRIYDVSVVGERL